MIPGEAGGTPPGAESELRDEGALGALRSYYRLSRSAVYGILLALPLLLLYELLVVWVNLSAAIPARNAADVWLRRLLSGLGVQGSLAVTALLVAGALLYLLREMRLRPLPIIGRYFPWMLAESSVLALAFGSVVGGLTALLLGPLAGIGPGEAAVLAPVSLASQGLSFGQQLVLSLGAGLYEELIFRVLLIPAIALVLERLAGQPPRRAVGIAVLVSALLFSLLHYVGPLGDELALGSFTFRFLGGLAFSLIFVLRGFGIVCWTHALYDVFLLLSRA